MSPTVDLREGFRRPKVADFSTHLSGPMASHLLNELGADVVKIENPRTGDGNRGVTPLIHGVGNMHVALSAGTRSIAVDRRSPHWSEVVEACARWADVVLVGARPRDAERLGIDFATMVRHKPDLVYCLISGYGEAGPWQDLTAHGQTMDAMAGLVPIEWHDGTPKTPLGWRSTGTTLAGVHASLGIMYALYQRASGFSGPLYVTVSVWGAAMSWSWRDLNCEANLGHAWNEYQDLGSRYAMYGTGDHRVLILAPAERKFWEQFCDVAGLPGLRAKGAWEGGMDFGKGPEYEEERAVIARRIAEQTLSKWVDLLSETDVPFAPVLTVAEAMSSEHAQANGVMRPTTVDGQPAQIAGGAVRVASGGDEAEAPGSVSPPPRIGEHTDEILAELGLGDLTGQL